MSFRVLVAGASGFLGRNLMKAIPKDWEVLATYRSASDFPSFLETQGLDQITGVRVNLSNERETKSKLGVTAFDAIVNLAGNVDMAFAQESPSEDWLANVQTVINLRRHCRTGHFVQFSSGAVYDGRMGEVHPGLPLRPRLAYAISKLASEHYAQALPRAGGAGSVTIVRFFGAYGPHEAPRKIYSRLVRAFAIEKARTFTVVGDGRNLIDAMYVDDAVGGIRAILAEEPKDIVLDFGARQPLQVNELVQKAATLFGVRELEIRHESSPLEYIEFRCSPAAFEERYGFRPLIPLEEGLRLLADWMGDGTRTGP